MSTTTAQVTDAHFQLAARITRENGYDPESAWNRPLVLRDAQLIAEVKSCGELSCDECNARTDALIARADCLQLEVDRWVKWREEQPWLAEIHSYQQQVKNLADETQRLKYALSQFCDDEREMSISEGPGHSTCGLADELTERAERAEAALHAIQQGHGELGRREKIRLKYVEALARAENAERNATCARITCEALDQTARDLGKSLGEAKAELAKESARLDLLDEKLHIDLSRSSSEFDVYYVSFPKDRSKPTGPILSEKYVPLRSTIDKAMENP